MLVCPVGFWCLCVRLDFGVSVSGWILVLVCPVGFWCLCVRLDRVSYIIGLGLVCPVLLVAMPRPPTCFIVVLVWVISSCGGRRWVQFRWFLGGGGGYSGLCILVFNFM